MIFKMLSSKRYRAGLNQRFGITTERVSNKPGIWVHGASVGEVITAKSIIERIDEEFPEWETFISTSTNTGFSVAQKISPTRQFLFPSRLKLDNKEGPSPDKTRLYPVNRTRNLAKLFSISV